MVDVETTITIARPVAEVAAFAADPDNATRWYENIKEVEWRTAKPLGVGTRIRFVAGFLGRGLAYTYEVRELSRSHMVMSTEEGPFPMQTTYTCHVGPSPLQYEDARKLIGGSRSEGGSKVSGR